MSTAVSRIPDTKLPLNYEAARAALTACVLVDECKEWKDRAAAIASYAAQKRDRTLLDKATRIRARATRRLGELIELQSPDQRRLSDLGVNHAERSQARAVASIPEGTFEEHVERNPPTPISRLAQMGRGPIDFDASAKIWVAAERLRKNMREFPAALLAQDIANCTSEQKAALKKAFLPVHEWLDEIAALLKI
jgi:hypothetical protein